MLWAEPKLHLSSSLFRLVRIVASPEKIRVGSLFYNSMSFLSLVEPTLPASASLALITRLVRIVMVPVSLTWKKIRVGSVV
jgi:hypothetical protein